MATRKIYFVCSGTNLDGAFISDEVEARSKIKAVQLFSSKFGNKPTNIHGPYYQKKKKILSSSVDLVFSGKSGRYKYMDWVVDAFELADPEDFSYLIFIENYKNSNLGLPNKSIIVETFELERCDDG